MKLRERMRELRKERKETHVQAALEIGMTDRRYRRSGAGENPTEFKSLCALPEDLGVSLDSQAGRAGRR